MNFDLQIQGYDETLATVALVNSSGTRVGWTNQCCWPLVLAICSLIAGSAQSSSPLTTTANNSKRSTTWPPRRECVSNASPSAICNAQAARGVRVHTPTQHGVIAARACLVAAVRCARACGLNGERAVMTRTVEASRTSMRVRCSLNATQRRAQTLHYSARTIVCEVPNCMMPVLRVFDPATSTVLNCVAASSAMRRKRWRAALASFLLLRSAFPFSFLDNHSVVQFGQVGNATTHPL